MLIIPWKTNSEPITPINTLNSITYVGNAERLMFDINEGDIFEERLSMF